MLWEGGIREVENLMSMEPGGDKPRPYEKQKISQLPNLYIYNLGYVFSAKIY